MTKISDNMVHVNQIINAVRPDDVISVSVRDTEALIHVFATRGVSAVGILLPWARHFGAEHVRADTHRDSNDVLTVQMKVFGATPSGVSVSVVTVVHLAEFTAMGAKGLVLENLTVPQLAEFAERYTPVPA